MAITVTWGTKVINIPQADLTFIGGTLYSLDVDAFRLRLKDLEDDEEGIVFIRTHNHNTELVIGGVTYARSVEIINGYTVTFENGNYRVSLVGANNNISDVTNLNNVSILSNNSAGLVNLPEVTEMHKLHGLDADNPLDVSDSARSAGADIQQTITEPVPGTTRVTRT